MNYHMKYIHCANYLMFYLNIYLTPNLSLQKITIYLLIV